ncbi:MAG: cobalt ECF transporter T component CbiQ [Nitrospirae bacterium]|nr:cobalt ECF transporter T component CbiQ [Nitrospirota bacterium]MBF0533628.1 cobalt ECF transporter T component CbiQ [Nitrospirota bacterium]MBF0616721.1 cobalt ECF transporter T component CbiQ [Nitrospirota bacterium]
MISFEKEYFNLGFIDKLAYKDCFMQSIDPRVKIITTAAFTIVVVSYSKYELTGLMPFFLFPMVCSSLGDVPLKYVLKKLLFFSVFPLLIGIFNPLIDTKPVFFFMNTSVSGGWISLISIFLKFQLTFSFAVIFIATTPLPQVCAGLKRLGVPDIFTSQLMFLYRYIFVLAEETMRMLRARGLRTFGEVNMSMKDFINLAGLLFIKTCERAERIYRAMLSRGFSNTIHSIKDISIKHTDLLYLAITTGLLIFFRLYDVAALSGRAITGGFLR